MCLCQLRVLRQLGNPPSIWQGNAPVGFVSDLSSWPSVPKEANNFYGVDGSFEPVSLFLDGLCLFTGPNFITKNTLINYHSKTTRAWSYKHGEWCTTGVSFIVIMIWKIELQFHPLHVTTQIHGTWIYMHD